jgi:hypothetical protein
MSCQDVGVPHGELQEFSHYLSLVSTVMRRFSIVQICSKRLLAIFSSPVYCWFADKIGLCVALALHLWECRNFVRLFEQATPGWMYRGEGGRMYSFKWRGGYVALCRPYIPCNLQDDFHNRGHIGHHYIFLFGGIGLSRGHLRIWPISIWGGDNFCGNFVRLVWWMLREM